MSDVSPEVPGVPPITGPDLDQMATDAIVADGQTPNAASAVQVPQRRNFLSRLPEAFKSVLGISDNGGPVSSSSMSPEVAGDSKPAMTDADVNTISPVDTPPPPVESVPAPSPVQVPEIITEVPDLTPRPTATPEDAAPTADIISEPLPQAPEIPIPPENLSTGVATAEVPVAPSQAAVVPEGDLQSLITENAAESQATTAVAALPDTPQKPSQTS